MPEEDLGSYITKANNPTRCTTQFVCDESVLCNRKLDSHMALSSLSKRIKKGQNSSVKTELSSKVKIPNITIYEQRNSTA